MTCIWTVEVHSTSFPSASSTSILVEFLYYNVSKNTTLRIGTTAVANSTTEYHRWSGGVRTVRTPANFSIPASRQIWLSFTSHASGTPLDKHGFVLRFSQINATHRPPVCEGPVYFQCADDPFQCIDTKYTCQGIDYEIDHVDGCEDSSHNIGNHCRTCVVSKKKRINFVKNPCACPANFPMTLYEYEV